MLTGCCHKTVGIRHIDRAASVERYIARNIQCVRSQKEIERSVRNQIAIDRARTIDIENNARGNVRIHTLQDIMRQCEVCRSTCAGCEVQHIIKISCAEEIAGQCAAYLLKRYRLTSARQINRRPCAADRTSIGEAVADRCNGYVLDVDWLGIAAKVGVRERSNSGRNRRTLDQKAHIPAADRRIGLIDQGYASASDMHTIA